MRYNRAMRKVCSPEREKTSEEKECVRDDCNPYNSYLGQIYTGFVGTRTLGENCLENSILHHGQTSHEQHGCSFFEVSVYIKPRATWRIRYFVMVNVLAAFSKSQYAPNYGSVNYLCEKSILRRVLKLLEVKGLTIFSALADSFNASKCLQLLLGEGTFPTPLRRVSNAGISSSKARERSGSPGADKSR